jgi:hypothetical protein
MSTRDLPGGKGGPARKADNLTTICEPIVQKMWEPRRLTTLWAFTACYRDSFAFCFYLNKVNITVKRVTCTQKEPSSTLTGRIRYQREAILPCFSH